jgi:hypothetical protein
MKCWIVWPLSLSIFLIASFATGDEKKPVPPKDPYAELFSFPAKVTLDEMQKEKLAALRKTYEPGLAQSDKSIEGYSRFRDKLTGETIAVIQRHRDKRVRAVVRKKNGILTDEQRAALGIKLCIPSFAQEKALNDENIWDLSHLEKIFTIQSRSFDPEEQVISFNVITKRKWTQKEREIDAKHWGGGERLNEPPVKVTFYNKQEETSFVLTGRYYTSARAFLDGGIWRSSLKLTDKQAEEGLLRFRIKIDLDDDLARGREAATVKFVYPEPK